MPKKFKIRGISFLIILLLFISFNIPKARADSGPQIDNVFTFQSPYQELFHALELKNAREYNIHFEIVSPHNCSITINILDPDDALYELFTIDVNSQNALGYSKDIPYVAAINGTHYLFVQVSSQFDLNIHILVEETGKFTFGGEYFNKVIPSTIEKVHDSYSRQYNYSLKKNFFYDFIFERVSTIPESLDILATIYFWIQPPSPNNTFFLLLSNVELNDAGQPISISFGAAVGGIYVLNYSISTDVEPFNLASGIDEKYQITQIYDENETVSSPENDTESNEDSRNSSGTNSTDNNSGENSSLSSFMTENESIFISNEQAIGTYSLVGGGATLIVIFFILHKRKNKIMY